MKRQIAVSKEVREKLMKVFGVTERTVFNALAMGKEGNLLHKKIRKAALDSGGVLMVTIPEVETFFDTGVGMRQYLPNGAVLEFSFADGSCDTWFKGERMDRREKVAVSEIRGIQARAAALK